MIWFVSPHWVGGYPGQVQPGGTTARSCRGLGVPCLVQPGVYPCQGVPWPGPAGKGYPCQGVPHPWPGHTWGTPHLDLASIPPNPRLDGGTPPPTGTDWVTHPPAGVPSPPPGTGQQMEYLIRRGRYTSCVHAGGLSCFFCMCRTCSYP